MISAWSVLAGIAWAPVAFAQQEQWLQYRTSPGGMGYHWLDLTTNPPPNVVLPKLSAPPYFARWATPLDPSGGRWLCFDRTRKAGPHDRVFFDRNGNGRLDDDAPATATRRDQYSSTFEPLRLTFKGEDGPITYHLGIRFMKYDDDDVRALVESAGSYEGTVQLAGKKQRLQLIDANVNGTFNDRSSSLTDCDRIRVGEAKDDDLGQRYLGRLLEVDGQFFQIEVARDGAFVKIQKAENVSLGRVRVPDAISQFIAIGESGHFLRKPVKGEFTLPVGQYRVHRWAIDRKDAKGAAWKLSGYSYGDAAEFEVAAAQPTSLEVGEPLRAALQASESKGTVSFSLRLQGRFGESVEIMRGTQRPRAPLLTLASPDGSYRFTNTFEYG